MNLKVFLPVALCFMGCLSKAQRKELAETRARAYFSRLYPGKEFLVACDPPKGVLSVTTRCSVVERGALVFNTTLFRAWCYVNPGVENDTCLVVTQ